MNLEPFWWDIDQVLTPIPPAGDMLTNVDFVIVGGGLQACPQL